MLDPRASAHPISDQAELLIGVAASLAITSPRSRVTLIISASFRRARADAS